MSIVVREVQPITAEGYARLEAELEVLMSGPRDEEAEARVDELRSALSLSRITEPPEPGVAGIGRRVSLRLAGAAKPTEYDLVGPFEADSARRRISVSSPIGRALEGHRAGDHVEAETPGGIRTVEILDVTAPPAS